MNRRMEDVTTCPNAAEDRGTPAEACYEKDEEANFRETLRNPSRLISMRNLDPAPLPSGREEPHHQLEVGIIDANTWLAASLRRAIDLSPSMRCAGIWCSAEKLLREPDRPEPQVLLMNLDQTGDAGVVSIRFLKRHMPKMRVLIISDIVNPSILSKAITAGACGYLFRSSFAETTHLPLAMPVSAPDLTTVSIGSAVADQPHTAQDRLRIDNESIPLSGQETAVVRMIAEGLFYKEIAIKLKIAESTVKTYVKNICNKINVRSRTEIAVKYIKWQQMDR